MGMRPTSQVFDFTFDFNFKLVRRDSKNTSIRIDYSNVQGYWDTVADSPGIQSDGPNKRFFAPFSHHWIDLLKDSSTFE